MESSGSVKSALGGLSFAEWELILICVVVLVLFGENGRLPFARRFVARGIKEFLRSFRGGGQEAGKSLGAGLGKPVADALTHSNQTWEIQDPPALRLRHIKKQMRNQLIVWMAQGFGVGRIPFAPGSFGSVVGLLWFVLLLLPANPWSYAGGVVAGVFLSVWVSGAAEKILRQTDPGSIVLDEITAVPLCFGVWIADYCIKHGAMPGPELFFSRDTWPLTLAVFVGFRFFDVIKPWPVRQSQKLPGGWGVTLDDVLAALYVNILTALTFSIPVSR